MTPSDRGKLLWKLADLLEENLDEFAQLESIDNGKPRAVAAAADVPLAIDLFRYMAGWATKIEGNTIPISVPYAPGAHFHSFTLREPVGVVGQIIPWNFPLLMAAWKLGPALAVGCTVVLKVAEETPMTGLRLVDDFGTGDIGGHQVRRKLHAFELEVENLREGANEQRFRQPRCAGDEAVVAGEQHDEQFFHHGFLADDDAPDFLLQLLTPGPEFRQGFFFKGFRRRFQWFHFGGFDIRFQESMIPCWLSAPKRGIVR